MDKVLLFFCLLGVKQLLCTIILRNLISLYIKGIYCLYSVQEIAQILFLQIVCFRNMPHYIKYSYFLKVSCNKSSGIRIVIIPAYTQPGHSGPDSVEV